MIDNNKFQKNSLEKSADIKNISSGHILSNISNFLPKAKGNNWLNIIKYNKELLKRTDVSVFLKKRCWLDYCEKILTGDIFFCEQYMLIYELFEAVFNEDMAQIENALKNKPKEEQEQFHYDDTTGEIDGTFKLVLKTYCLQDILFDLFSIDGNDIIKLDFVENGLGDLNLNSADLLNKVIIGVLTSKEKQNARLNKLNEIITRPDKKIVLKTFDEHNAQNKNFVPEEKRGLWYQMSLNECLKKVKKTIDTEYMYLIDNIDIAQDELNRIVETKPILLKKLIANRKIINDTVNEDINAEVKLKKLCRCKNLFSNNPGQLPFRVKFIENQSGESSYKTEYDIEIKYDEIDELWIEPADRGLANQVLNDIDSTNPTPEALYARKKELLKSLIDYQQDLCLKYDLDLQQAVGLDEYIKSDLSQYGTRMQQKIIDIVNAGLDSYITDFKLCRVKNKIKRFKAEQNCQIIRNQFNDFDAQNNAQKSELNKIVQTSKTKKELLANVWCSFNQDNSNEFDPVGSDLDSNICYLWMLNGIYFNDNEMSLLYAYINQNFGGTSGAFALGFDHGLRAYCRRIRDQYYNVETKERQKLIIHRLCFIIMKHPKCNGDKNKAIEICEDVFFLDDIRECRKHCNDMSKYLKIALVSLAILALTCGLICVLEGLLESMELSKSALLLFLFMLGLGGIETASLNVLVLYILRFGYNLFKYFPEIRRYRAYKKELAQRRKDFYNFDYEAEYKQADDFKKNIEKQKQLLGLYMKYGEKVPAQAENAQIVNNLAEDNSAL